MNVIVFVKLINVLDVDVISVVPIVIMFLAVFAMQSSLGIFITYTVY